MSDKQQILDTLKNEFDQWEALLAGMSEEQITSPYAPDKPYNRSIKDVIAHLRAWQQRSIARCEAALQDREPKFPRWPTELNPNSEDDVDRINAWLYANSRDQAWTDVHREWREGFLKILELGEAIPENNLLATGKYPWMPEYSLAFILRASFEHHHEHREPLVAWLQGRDQVLPCDRRQE